VRGKALISSHSHVEFKKYSFAIAVLRLLKDTSSGLASHYLGTFSFMCTMSLVVALRTCFIFSHFLPTSGKAAPAGFRSAIVTTLLCESTNRSRVQSLLLDRLRNTTTESFLNNNIRSQSSFLLLFLMIALLLDQAVQGKWLSGHSRFLPLLTMCMLVFTACMPTFTARMPASTVCMPAFSACMPV